MKGVISKIEENLIFRNPPIKSTINLILSNQIVDTLNEIKSDSCNNIKVTKFDKKMLNKDRLLKIILPLFRWNCWRRKLVINDLLGYQWTKRSKQQESAYFGQQSSLYNLLSKCVSIHTIVWRITAGFTRNNDRRLCVYYQNIRGFWIKISYLSLFLLLVCYK